jgi:hypothetical protein
MPSSMTMTTALILSTAVAVSSAAISSTATVASTTAIPTAAVAVVTTAPVSSSPSSISTVIASISPASSPTISPARIATTFISAATGTRGSNGDAIGSDGSVPGGREDQHVRPASAGNLQIIELGSAILVRDSRGGSGQSTATRGDRCRHGDAARSKVVTFGVLYLDCRLAAQLDASGS